MFFISVDTKKKINAKKIGTCGLVSTGSPSASDWLATRHACADGRSIQSVYILEWGCRRSDELPPALSSTNTHSQAAATAKQV